MRPGRRGVRPPWNPPPMSDHRPSAAARSSVPPGPEGGCAASVRPLVADIFTINNIAMRIGDRLAKPMGLTSSRWMLLCLVAHAERPPTVGELSTAADLSVQNVSRMLGAMEAEGLVRRSPCPEDARKCVVELTERGERAAAATAELAASFDCRFLQGFDAARVARLQEDLSELVANLKAFEAELASSGASAPGTPEDGECS